METVDDDEYVQSSREMLMTQYRTLVFTRAKGKLKSWL
jgi:hypothetical protein